MTNKNVKNLVVVFGAVVSLAAWASGGYILYRYEYFQELGAVDNLVGAIPIAFVIIGAGGITALTFIRHTKQFAAVSATIGAFVILSVVLYPTALRGNWWIKSINPGISDTGPDLSVFEPFLPDSQTAKLDGISSLKLDTDLPLLDGATALYPVYAAFAESAYNAAAYTQSAVRCTNTRGAYESVIKGERDIIFVAGASAGQIAAAAAAGAELKFTPIGYEAFVFIVGKNNPVGNISYQQIKNIYSGKTARWSTLGWKEGGSIIAFQRPEGSGSQTGLQNIMGNMPVQAPQPLPDKSLYGTNSLMRQVSVEWKGVQPAIGYSYRYYATKMYANPDAKLLSIDGFYPSEENIRNKNYPFVAEFFAVTGGEPTGNIKLLIDWILSPQGQELIEKTGYTGLGAAL